MHMGQDACADHIQHARHHRHDRGPDRQHVGRQMFDAPGVGDFGADAEQEELARRVFVAVRQRQEGQIHLAPQPKRAQQFERTAAIRQDGAVRQHDPLRRAASARGVDEARQRGRRDTRRRLRHVIGRAVGLRDQARPGPHGGRCRRAFVHRHQHVEGPRLQQPCGQCGCGGNRHACAGVAQQMRVIRDGVGDVGRHRHGGEGQQRRLGDRELGAVLADQQHAVTGRHAGRAQRACRRRRESAETAPVHPLPGAIAMEPQHGAVRPVPRAREHQGGEIRPVRVALVLVCLRHACRAPCVRLARLSGTRPLT